MFLPGAHLMKHDSIAIRTFPSLGGETKTRQIAILQCVRVSHDTAQISHHADAQILHFLDRDPIYYFFHEGYILLYSKIYQ